MKKAGFIVLVIGLLCASIAAVIQGQRMIGPIGLCVMLSGLSGLLILLWGYNRRYR